jgi:hypothetical protein
VCVALEIPFIEFVQEFEHSTQRRPSRR